MVKFSICLPTRERIARLKKLLSSIKSTASDPTSIQIVCRVDLDDELTSEFLEEYKDLQLDYITGRRGTLSNMWQECYPLAKGDYIMMCADDAIFRTENWDDIIIQRAPNPDSTPYFIWANDKHFKERLSTLPIVSRKWVELCEFFVPPGYARGWCDTHMHDIAKKLRKLGHDTMIYCDDIIIEHMHPDVNKAPIDNTYHYRLSMPSPRPIYIKRESERHETARQMRAKIEAAHARTDNSSISG